MIGTRSAKPLGASGHNRPHQKAEYMTAPDRAPKIADCLLPKGGRPYMTKERWRRRSSSFPPRGRRTPHTRGGQTRPPRLRHPRPQRSGEPGAHAVTFRPCTGGAGTGGAGMLPGRSGMGSRVKPGNDDGGWWRSSNHWTNEATTFLSDLRGWGGPQKLGHDIGVEDDHPRLLASRGGSCTGSCSGSS